MKKTLIIIITFIVYLFWAHYCIWNIYNFPYKVQENWVNKEILQNEDSAWKKLKKNFFWDKDYTTSNFISIIINYFLSILAIIALIFMFRWASFVFTWKTDEWIKKWKKFMTMALLAIFIIWVSWLISMFIFNIYNQ